MNAPAGDLQGERPVVRTDVARQLVVRQSN